MGVGLGVVGLMFGVGLVGRVLGLLVVGVGHFEGEFGLIELGRLTSCFGGVCLLKISRL